MSATDEISPALSKTEHSPELAACYADKLLFGVRNIGWGVLFRIVDPLIALRLLELEQHENIQATIASVKGIALALCTGHHALSDRQLSRL